MRLLLVALLLGSVAWADANDHAAKVEKLVGKLRKTVHNGVSKSDAAAGELNRRLDAITHEVRSAVKDVKHTGHATDKEMRAKVKRDLQSFSRYVQSLSDEVFKKIDQTVEELQKETEEMP